MCVHKCFCATDKWETRYCVEIGSVCASLQINMWRLDMPEEKKTFVYVCSNLMLGCMVTNGGRKLQDWVSNITWYESKEDNKKKGEMGKKKRQKKLVNKKNPSLIVPRPQNSLPIPPARRLLHPSSRLKETQHPLETTTTTRTASHSPKHLQVRGYASCA